MRIGLFLIQFPGPIETFIITKVLGLLEAGVDVQIFAALPSPYWNRYAILKERDDLHRRVHLLPPTTPWWRVITSGLLRLTATAIRQPAAFSRYVHHTWYHRHQHPLKFWRALYLRLPFVGEHLDILHIEFDSQGVNVVDLKDYLECKLVLSSRDVLQRTGVFYRSPGLPANLFQYADGYHVLAEWLRRNLLHLGLPPHVLVRTIPPAIDVELFAPTPSTPLPNGDKKQETEPHFSAPPGPFHASRFTFHIPPPTPSPPHPLNRPTPQPLEILSVGRIAWEKGYEFALDAVRHVRDAGVPVHYTIVGAGAYEEAVRFAARQHGLLQDGTVTFAGAVGREATTAYYRRADIFLHAALQEGFGNSVIEAQAMALPVVTSDANGLPENVADGVTGFVVPRRDPQALADKVLLLARDPALRTRLGQAGRERAVTHFNLRNYTPQFLQLYQDLLAPKDALV
jgi:colanic acid/amylovoran biosynthesis glycosyltransferase